MPEWIHRLVYTYQEQGTGERIDDALLRMLRAGESDPETQRWITLSALLRGQR